MNVIWQLTLRNSRIYLRDKTSVFFSFLSIIIIILMYAAFLAQMQVDGIKEQVGDIQGIRFVVDSWIMSGIIAVNSVTVSLAVLSTMIEDQVKKTSYDFMSAPIKRSQIILGYVFSAWLVGIVLTLFNLLIGEIYIVLSGGQFLSFVATLKVIAIIILSVVSFSSMLLFIITFIQSRTALGTLNTIVGTFIGFLTGIYIPIGVLGESIQTIIKLFPVSYSATLLRQVFMEQPIQQVFEGAPLEASESYKELYGIVLKWNGHVMSNELMIGAILVFGLVFLLLSILKLNLSKHK